MKDHIHFEVTQEHIDKGIPSNACQCPIALAFNDWLKENDPTAGRIEVDSSDIIIYYPDDDGKIDKEFFTNTRVFRPSESISDFIINFDTRSREDIDPIEIVIPGNWNSLFGTDENPILEREEYEEQPDRWHIGEE